MQNQTKYLLRKIKLQRLIPYYKKLKIKAVQDQDYENAAIYRRYERGYVEELKHNKVMKILNDLMED